VLVFVCN